LIGCEEIKRFKSMATWDEEVLKIA